MGLEWNMSNEWRSDLIARSDLVRSGYAEMRPETHAVINSVYNLLRMLATNADYEYLLTTNIGHEC